MDRDLRRMRIANRFGSPRFIAITVAVVMAAVFVPLGASIMLGVRGLPIVFAIFVPLGAFAAFAAWAGGGNALLGQLREYEEASGKQVLPLDLHVRPQQPSPRWRQ